MQGIPRRHSKYQREVLAFVPPAIDRARKKKKRHQSRNRHFTPFYRAFPLAKRQSRRNKIKKMIKRKKKKRREKFITCLSLVANYAGLPQPCEGGCPPPRHLADLFRILAFEYIPFIPPLRDIFKTLNSQDQLAKKPSYCNRIKVHR